MNSSPCPGRQPPPSNDGNNEREYEMRSLLLSSSALILMAFTLYSVSTQRILAGSETAAAVVTAVLVLGVAVALVVSGIHLRSIR